MFAPPAHEFVPMCGFAMELQLHPPERVRFAHERYRVARVLGSRTRLRTSTICAHQLTSRRGDIHGERH